jgi:hypothetical protein
MLIYLTYNDLPSGIYSSQVIDVVKFIQENTTKKVRLIAFISLRDFIRNRKKIKQELASAYVLPMFPGNVNWQKNCYLLRLVLFFLRPSLVIARSVQATLIAKKAIRPTTKLVYDGRGAISAEWNEYNVVQDANLKSQIHQWEKIAIQRACFRIAVSNQLVQYWQHNFNYTGTEHVIIPCTLNEIFLQPIDPKRITAIRTQLGYLESNRIFVFSGSLAGWQSIELIKAVIDELLQADANNRLLFLSETNQVINELIRDFPEKVNCLKVPVKEVPVYLSVCQFGLLIREKSTTNRVASPVKFAEYLACGLNVIISEELGDYSEFVRANKCGEVFQLGKRLLYTGQSPETNRKLALENFSKANHKASYLKLLELA